MRIVSDVRDAASREYPGHVSIGYATSSCLTGLNFVSICMQSPAICTCGGTCTQSNCKVPRSRRVRCLLTYCFSLCCTNLCGDVHEDLLALLCPILHSIAPSQTSCPEEVAAETSLQMCLRIVKKCLLCKPYPHDKTSSCEVVTSAEG